MGHTKKNFFLKLLNYVLYRLFDFSAFSLISEKVNRAEILGYRTISKKYWKVPKPHKGYKIQLFSVNATSGRVA
jgi:hypothetical protein